MTLTHIDLFCTARRFYFCCGYRAALRGTGARPQSEVWPPYLPNEILRTWKENWCKLSVTGHLGWKFSDYMLDLCQKLHITNNFFRWMSPFVRPLPPAVSPNVDVLDRDVPVRLLAMFCLLPDAVKLCPAVSDRRRVVYVRWQENIGEMNWKKNDAYPG